MDTERRSAPPPASSQHSRISPSTSRADPSAFGADLRFFLPMEASERRQKSLRNDEEGDTPATQRRFAPRLVMIPTLLLSINTHRRGGQRELPARTSAQLTST